MGKIAAKAKPLQKRPTVRSGRPRRELVGEVDERILDAARRAFLERGLSGASIDEIANLARAGKPTIYARFPGKEALFTAVVMRARRSGVIHPAACSNASRATLPRRVLTISLRSLSDRSRRQLMRGPTARRATWSSGSSRAASSSSIVPSSAHR